MKMKDLVSILILEFIVIGFVILIFHLIPSKAQASIGAGLAFIGIGIWINILALRWSGFFQSATFWAAQIHLFFSAIPLFVYRMLNYRTGFSQIQIFGIPGPLFHRISTVIYLLLIISTLVDLGRLRLQRASEK